MKIFIICLLFISGLFAEATDISHKFTALCTEDATTGFNWKNGGWKQVNFKANNYIVKKMDITDCDADNENKRNKWKWDETVSFNILKACYNIRNHGEKLSSFDTDSCYEEWRKVNNKFQLDKIECENMGFIPNGNFIKSFIYASKNNLSDNPPNGYKDSIYVSHGKCSIIE